MGCVGHGGRIYGELVGRRRAQFLVGLAAVVFLTVTFGLAPTINLIARLRSPHSYSRYEFAGTWMLGLLAGGLVTGTYAAVAMRTGDRASRTKRTWPCAVRAAALDVLTLPNACTAIGATVTGLGVGSAADNVVRFNQDRAFTVSLGGVLVGFGLGGMLIGRLVARGATKPRWLLLLVEFGTLLAGWALGGGLDNLLSESAGQAYSFAFAAALAGLGCGLAFIGWASLNTDR
jgi:hypothetical protein